MWKRTFAVLLVTMLGLTGIALAQENATITLRSGERLTGQLLDMGGVGFTVRVGGQERQIPTTDVAIIDFTGGGAADVDWNKFTGGQHVMWLKSGQVITGQLTDVGGATPLRITV